MKSSRCYEKFQVIRPAVLATVCGVWNELSAGTSEICSAFDPYVGCKAKIYAHIFSLWRYLLGVRNISMQASNLWQSESKLI